MEKALNANVRYLYWQDIQNLLSSNGQKVGEHTAKKKMQEMACVQMMKKGRGFVLAVTESNFRRWQYENTVIPAEQKNLVKRKRPPVTGTWLLEYRHSGR